MELNPLAVAEFIRDLRKITDEAFGHSDEEHYWYHVWDEVFGFLNRSSSDSVHRFSTAPQRRYEDTTNNQAVTEREEPPVTRSQAALDFFQLEEADDDNMDEDVAANTSFSTAASAAELDTPQKRRTPDFSIFRYLTTQNTLCPVVIIEVKPLEIKIAGMTVNSSSDPNNAAAFLLDESVHQLVRLTIKKTETQAQEQLQCVFAECSVDQVIFMFIVGPFYTGVLFTRDMLTQNAPLANLAETDLHFLFSSATMQHLNDNLWELWASLNAM